MAVVDVKRADELKIGDVIFARGVTEVVELVKLPQSGMIRVATGNQSIRVHYPDTKFKVYPREDGPEN